MHSNHHIKVRLSTDLSTGKANMGPRNYTSFIEHQDNLHEHSTYGVITHGIIGTLILVFGYFTLSIGEYVIEDILRGWGWY